MRNSIASRPLRSSKSGQTEFGDIWQQYDILAVPYLPIFVYHIYAKQISYPKQTRILYHIILLLLLFQVSEEV